MSGLILHGGTSAPVSKVPQPKAWHPATTSAKAVGPSRASVSLQPHDLRDDGGWARGQGDAQPPKLPCLHASEPRPVRVLHPGHPHHSCHHTSWHSFGPAQLASPQKALGMVQGTVPSRWTRPPHFWGAAEGSSRREAWLQTQHRHLEGSASMSPFLPERGLGCYGALSSFRAESCLSPFPSPWLAGRPSMPSPSP